MYNVYIYKKFKNLLTYSKKEKPLQEFLENNPYIICKTFNIGGHYPLVFPKFKLADSFIPDFIEICQRSAPDWDMFFIEIEPPVLSQPLFNKKKQSTGRLREAEGQVVQWQIWVEKNSNFLIRKLMEKIKNEHLWDDNPWFQHTDIYNLTFMTWYKIIIGRRKDFENWGKEYRSNLSENTGNKVEIVSWDRLLENVRPPKRVVKSESKKNLKKLMEEIKKAGEKQ